MDILTTEEFVDYLKDLEESRNLVLSFYLVGNEKMHGRILKPFIEVVEKSVEQGKRAWGPLRGKLTLEDIENPKAMEALENLDEEETDEWLYDPEPLYKFPQGDQPLSDELWEIWRLSPGFLFHFSVKKQCIEVWVYMRIGERFIEPEYPFNLTERPVRWFTIPFSLLSEDANDGFKELLDKAVERWAPKEDEEDEDDDD